MKITQIFKRLEREEEMIVIKKLTYLRIFILIFFLMTIDTFSSYIAVKHPLIYEMNTLSAVFFEIGLFGVFAWYFLVIIYLAITFTIVYSIEQTFFKHKAQIFRLKILYAIMGMYLYVFANNLRSLINVLI